MVQNVPQTPTPSVVSGAASEGSMGPPPRKKEKRQKRDAPQAYAVYAPSVILQSPFDAGL